MTSPFDPAGGPAGAPVPPGASASFCELLLSSHECLTGRPLCPPAWSSYEEAAAWLYARAPFGLLAHDTADDPVFVYANRTAQERFGYDWDTFTALPSRLSAAPTGQEDRDSFVRSVAERGYAEGYRGRRIASSGRPFWIEDVTMWNLVDAEGGHHGQAAVFRSWSPARRAV
ncbi:MEKHLA domain-containing protein [Streptomyces fuscigenes]|uniref:MEKHLA domain-containing protein n=1 Tax=Streptomyces fuscigenes TaxID=1528880 RepID=UPI001F1D4CFF|nr:MEKHLA domain-containing protein [Streptomyces fuscigenes]MCF3962923.1 MEKHLA domain-containing protein [Streptomyces fuscigenes]